MKGVRLHHRPHQSRRKKRNNKSWKPVKLFWKKQYSQENTWRFIQKFFQFEKKFDKCWPPDKRTLFLRFVVASSQVTFLCIEHFARVLDGSTSLVDVHFWIFSEVVVIREHNILKRGLKFICLLGCASVSIKFIWKQFHSIFIAIACVCFRTYFYICVFAQIPKYWLVGKLRSLNPVRSSIFHGDRLAWFKCTFEASKNL